jgi:hypothetical protein
MNNAPPDDGVTAPKNVGSCFNINFNIVFEDDSLVHQLVNKKTRNKCYIERYAHI